ncbi:hypothetical protein [Microbispora siamensis]|uniref:hypothetical protein n=1 Tax=Microbispora siamensis TaxID=564413 RepID=UPI0019527C33|nr:hypothetical protein [Microbispora siamensis]
MDKASHATYGAGPKTGQDVDVPLPYSKTLHVTGDLGLVTLFVQNPGADGSVTCQVKVDGKVVGEAETDNPYGVCRVQVDSLGE